jgi:hypothetical protein
MWRCKELLMTNVSTLITIFHKIYVFIVVTATEEKKKKRDEKTQDSVTMETTSWAKNFQVYPSVVPPPATSIHKCPCIIILKTIINTLDSPTQDITKIEADVAEAPLGPMQVIIGPTFNIDAYNYGVLGNEKEGIRSQKDRGVLSMDQQYNAFNFVYYVLRSKNSYERKVSVKRTGEGELLYLHVYD